jgi:hypothetical protein
LGCENNAASEPARSVAVERTLKKNPKAFRAKIQSKAVGAAALKKGNESLLSHSTGCRCKKTACLKKYCECFQAGIHCGNNCKCMDCGNFEGSTDLKIAESKLKREYSRTYSPTASKIHVAHGPEKKKAKKETRGTTSPTASPIDSPAASPPTIVGTLSLPLSPLAPLVALAKALQTPENSSAEEEEEDDFTFDFAPSVVAGMSELGDEDLVNAFGRKNPAVPKKLAVGVLQFLDNDDLYNQSFVSKRWCKLSLDKAIWEEW